MKQTITISLSFPNTSGLFKILGIYEREECLITVCKVYKSDKNHGDTCHIIESVSVNTNKNEVVPVKYYIINPNPRREAVECKFHYFRVAAINEIKDIAGLVSLVISAPEEARYAKALFPVVKPAEWDLNESPSITSINRTMGP